MQWWHQNSKMVLTIKGFLLLVVVVTVLWAILAWTYTLILSTPHFSHLIRLLHKTTIRRKWDDLNESALNFIKVYPNGKAMTVSKNESLARQHSEKLFRVATSKNIAFHLGQLVSSQRLRAILTGLRILR